MVEVWFALFCFMLTMFVILDGWDMGAGMLHLIVAKTDSERRQVIAAIGPLWSWHEVWLVAAGGTFVLAFPSVMAVSFAGFYLALWLVLWAFVLRGISIEVGGHMHDHLWQSGWDVVFAGANLLLAVLFGVAIGNVVRGVPLDATGRFTLPLFTHFGTSGRVGLLDWYTISTAALTTVLLAAHGATYLRLKTHGPVHERSDWLARKLWPAAAILFVVVSLETVVVRSALFRGLLQQPAAWFAVAVVAGGAVAVWRGFRGQSETGAFAGSCAVIAGLLGGAAASLFPVMLHSTLPSGRAITAYDGAAGGRGLTIALVWWPIALALALTYFVVIMREYRGKVRPVEDTQGFY